MTHFVWKEQENKAISKAKFANYLAETTGKNSAAESATIKASELAMAPFAMQTPF